MITEKNNVFYCDCGFSFQRGRSGAHDCADGLRNKLAESEARCAALAAENAGLKKANEIALKILNDEETLVTSLWASSVQEVEVKTTATDTFMAEVRAQGVESAGEYLEQYAQGLHEEARLVLQDAGELCNGFAAQLRKGAQS
ncbi:hypothetical protein [Enterobacter roggenkampii]|uniref:hypothetical protein n=1 Tax=Enterobacter roggenkampii TaxID=1812935 RepID=UPI0020056395|nr:hypothetical protein [Enterobacter roggenkampii]MCK6943196.1 hypothetical protein [Enterobacter roggenkampii]